MILFTPPPPVLPDVLPQVIHIEPDPNSHFPRLLAGGQPLQAVLPGTVPVIAGAGRPWDPSKISPYAWLDTTLSPISKDGSNQVSVWSDIAGSSRHATQSTTARKPIHVAANDWITLSATTRFLTTPSYLATGNTPFTVGIVGRISAMPTGDVSCVTFYRQGSGASGQQVYFKVGNSGGPYDKFSFAHYGHDVAGSLTPAINTDYVLIFEYTGTQKNLWVNGTLDVSVAYSAQNLPAVPTFVSIGPDPANPNNLGQSGIVRTMVFAQSVLTTAHRLKLEGYLAWKWGIQTSLTALHPYRTAPPTGL